MRRHDMVKYPCTVGALAIAWSWFGNPGSGVAQDARQEDARQEQARARRTTLAEQASQEPFGPPNNLPVTIALPVASKVVGTAAPREPRLVGATLETRAPINPNQQPAFAGQTRAPAHRSRTLIDVKVMVRGLRKPWGLAFLPDGRLLVNEKPGAMRIVSATGAVGKPISGLPPILYHESDGGLLDLVLDLGFADNRRLYFSFVGYRPDGNALMVASARLSPDDSRLEDLTQVITLPSFSNVAHYGGRLLLARDGTLLLGASERMMDETRLAAQDPKSPMGKVLRFNTDGSVPLDNPYAQVPGADPTVYTLGNRDTQGIAVQPGTRALWSTDHGPQGGDEINVLLPGHNYGWPLAAYGLEYTGKPINNGKTQWPGTDQPVYYWDPAIAPSGATFYAGELFPEWRGDLFVAALAGRHVSHLVIKADRVIAEERLLQDLNQRMRDIKQGPDGALWVITEDDKDGKILRLTPHK